MIVTVTSSRLASAVDPVDLVGVAVHRADVQNSLVGRIPPVGLPGHGGDHVCGLVLHARGRPTCR